MMLSLDTAYRSFGGEVEASSTPAICRLLDSRRHQLSAIAQVGSAKRLQIDENDLWICAQAKERDLVVVTGDIDIRQLSAFDPDLKILLSRK